jgi:vancomycin permeability regulator SanA
LVALLLVVVLVAAAPFAIVGLASAGRIKSLADAPARDVTIVFGAGLKDGRPSEYLAARLAIARDLYLSGKTKAILVSGDNLTPYHDEPTAMTDWLVEQGVPAARIVQDCAGEDTYASCVRAKQIFGVDQAILVTQSYHLPRAVATCRLVGVDAIGVGDDTMAKAHPDSWRRYQLRELLADVNLIWERLSGRQPILGDYDPRVDQVLGR